MSKEIVFKKILDFLAYKQASKQEVLQKLNKYADDEIIKEEIFSELEKLGFVDDMSYANNFVASCITSSKPRSRLQVKQFLYKKGISRDIIDRALLSWTDDIELSKAKDLIESKNFPQDRLVRYLQSKGFEYWVCQALIDNEHELK